MKITVVVAVLNCLVTHLVGGAVKETSSDATTGHPRGNSGL